jgi:hypothetical protein
MNLIADWELLLQPSKRLWLRNADGARACTRASAFHLALLLTPPSFTPFNTNIISLRSKTTQIYLIHTVNTFNTPPQSH